MVFRIRRCVVLIVGLLALAGGGRAGDWPHFLGPKYDFHSDETGLDLDFSESGPRKLWEVKRGKGHAGPVVVGDRAVFIHQVEKREVVVCVSAETGAPLWEHGYPVEVGQAYGIVDAPRSGPVADAAAGLVYTLGNAGDLNCLRLEDGSMVWHHSLPKVFGESPFFFGYGSTPLVYGDKLIVNVGAEGACVVAFDKATGAQIWATAHEWHGSYSSPIIAKLNGQDRLLVLTGGMVKPPTGGLLCIDPADGSVDSAFPWRSSNFTSVNAASPVACGEGRVFITEDYGLGGAMLAYDADFQPRVLWTLPELGCQFQTPIYHDGLLYGVYGNGGLLIACDATSGRPLWNEMFYQTTVEWQGRQSPLSLGHAHIVHVDGAFLCLGENGDLLRLEMNAGGYRILAKARLFYAPETWAPPVVSGGRLYIMQNEFEPRLICYDLRPASAGGAPSSD